MSGRVESSWPNLTKVGPSSSSISRRWRPSAGRFWASMTDERRSVRRSNTNPKPCFVATWAISRTRPIVRRLSASVAIARMLGGPRPGRSMGLSPAGTVAGLQVEPVPGTATRCQAPSALPRRQGAQHALAVVDVPLDGRVCGVAPGQLERLVACGAARRRGCGTRRRAPPGRAAPPGATPAGTRPCPAAPPRRARPVSSATSRTTPCRRRLVRPEPAAGEAPAAVVGAAVEQHPALAVGDHRRRPHLRRRRAQVGARTALPPRPRAVRPGRRRTRPRSGTCAGSGPGRTPTRRRRGPRRRGCAARPAAPTASIRRGSGPACPRARAGRARSARWARCRTGARPGAPSAGMPGPAKTAMPNLAWLASSGPVSFSRTCTRPSPTEPIERQPRLPK